MSATLQRSLAATRHVDEPGPLRVVVKIALIGCQPQILGVKAVTGQRRGDGRQDARPVEADDANLVLLAAEGPHVNLDLQVGREPRQEFQVPGNLGG